MSEKQIAREEEQLTEEMESASYSANPDFDRYYERALAIQAKKIDSQTLELARMNRVYARNVRSTKISEALSFLIQVIFKKIK